MMGREQDPLGVIAFGPNGIGAEADDFGAGHRLVDGVLKRQEPTPLLGRDEPAQSSADPGTTKAAGFGVRQFPAAPLHRHLTMKMAVVEIPRQIGNELQLASSEIVGHVRQALREFSLCNGFRVRRRGDPEAIFSAQQARVTECRLYLYELSSVMVIMKNMCAGWDGAGPG